MTNQINETPNFMSLFQTLDFNLTERIGDEVVEIREEKLEAEREKLLVDREEWLDENAHSISGCKFMTQTDTEDDEKEVKYIRICGGGSDACDIEITDDGSFRFNYFCQHRVEMTPELYIINMDGCEYITEWAPDEVLFNMDEDDDILVTNLDDIDADDLL